jgi:hypothetical protein
MRNYHFSERIIDENGRSISGPTTGREKLAPQCLRESSLIWVGFLILAAVVCGLMWFQHNRGVFFTEELASTHFLRRLSSPKEVEYN